MHCWFKILKCEFKLYTHNHLKKKNEQTKNRRTQYYSQGNERSTLSGILLAFIHSENSIYEEIAKYNYIKPKRKL